MKEIVTDGHDSKRRKINQWNFREEKPVTPMVSLRSSIWTDQEKEKGCTKFQYPEWKIGHY